MGEPPLRTPQSEDRLDSWKEIAAYLKRDLRTVQRWEKREEMPVHRHLHDRIGSVYASRAELDAWMRSRNLRSGQENEDNAASPDPPGQAAAGALAQELGSCVVAGQWRVPWRLERSPGCRGQSASGETQ